MLTPFQRYSLIEFQRQNMLWKFRTAEAVLKQLMGAINPFAANAIFGDNEAVAGEEGEEPTIKTNSMFEDDVLASDRLQGHYQGSQDRASLYQEHMKKLQNNDPTVRISGGSPSWQPKSR